MGPISRRSFLAVTALSAACSTRSPSDALVAKDLVFLTRKGCVNIEAMRENLDDALGGMGLQLNYQVIDLADLPETDTRRGYPTPTVLVGGHDLFGMPDPHPPYPTPT